MNDGGHHMSEFVRIFVVIVLLYSLFLLSVGFVFSSFVTEMGLWTEHSQTAPESHITLSGFLWDRLFLASSMLLATHRSLICLSPCHWLARAFCISPTYRSGFLYLFPHTTSDVRLFLVCSISQLPLALDRGALVVPVLGLGCKTNY